MQLTKSPPPAQDQDTPNIKTYTEVNLQAYSTWYIYSGRNKSEIQHPRRRNYDSAQFPERNKKCNGLRDKILVPLQSLQPHLRNLSQDSKISLNMVLETCQRPLGQPDRPLR